MPQIREQWEADRQIELDELAKLREQNKTMKATLVESKVGSREWEDSFGNVFISPSPPSPLVHDPSLPSSFQEQMGKLNNRIQILQRQAKPGGEADLGGEPDLDVQAVPETAIKSEDG